MTAIRREIAPQQIAVIYARVSSAAQTKRGDGLGSQETRCREFARMKGYEVATVFHDDISGGYAVRPAMTDMLDFLYQHKEQKPVVIIDDVSRLARNLEAHIQLRSLISDAGGRLESPSIEFGEDSDSILVENLLASVSQHQRQKNAEQTVNRMRARIMNGYWCFQAPIGYRYKRKAGQGKVLVPDEPIASIIKEALEAYADGRLQTQSEVRMYLERQRHFPKEKDKDTVHPQRVLEILKRPIYAGMVEAPKWNIAMRQGHHEGLISLKTYEQIQKRINEKAKAPARKNIDADFPLRGILVCDDCGGTLTACWSKGRNQKYPYYLCSNRGCPSYRKSIKRSVVENAFEKLLKAITPSAGIIDYTRKVLRDAWNELILESSTQRKELEHLKNTTQSKIDSLLDRIIDTQSTSVIKAYEQRISELEKAKLLYDEKLEYNGQSKESFEQLFEPAFRYLENPLSLWHSDLLDDKRKVLKLTFSERLLYSRKSGFRTTELSLPFKVLLDVSRNKNEMAHLRGETSNQLFDELASWRPHLSQDLDA